MPINNRFRRDQDKRSLPSGPEPAQHNPEHFIYGGEPMARSFGVPRQQLLTQSEVFEDEALSGTESRDNPAEEMPERCNHGKNLTGTPPIELVANSLIVRAREVLTRDSAPASLAITQVILPVYRGPTYIRLTSLPKTGLEAEILDRATSPYFFVLLTSSAAFIRAPRRCPQTFLFDASIPVKPVARNQQLAESGTPEVFGQRSPAQLS